MINLCNRREVRVVQGMDDLQRVRDRLDAAGIAHTVRSRGGWQSDRGRGFPGARPELFHTYRVFVHKRDEERAKAALS